MTAAEQYPNWFSKTAQPNFEQFLRPMSGQPHLRFLQLGAFTGDASEWLLDNVLTHSSSKLCDVDTWEGSKESAHETMDFKDVYKVYQKKIKRFSGRVWDYRGTTSDFLLHDAGCCDCGGHQYNFIYVDADHTTVGVLLDAELSWPLLKSGGIMAFDDYTWGDHYPMHQRPKPGIDLFLLRHSGEYDVLAVNLQYWIRKK